MNGIAVSQATPPAAHRRKSTAFNRCSHWLAQVAGARQDKGEGTGKVRPRPGCPRKSSSAEATGAATSAFQDAAFFLRQSAPDPRVLARLYGPSQTGLSDLAAMADGLRLFDLAKRWTGNPGREEQLGVHVQTGSDVTPSHRDRAPRKEAQRLGSQFTRIVRCHCGPPVSLRSCSGQRQFVRFRSEFYVAGKDPARRSAPGSPLPNFCSSQAVVSTSSLRWRPVATPVRSKR